MSKLGIGSIVCAIFGGRPKRFEVIGETRMSWIITPEGGDPAFGRTAKFPKRNRGQDGRPVMRSPYKSWDFHEVYLSEDEMEKDLWVDNNIRKMMEQLAYISSHDVLTAIATEFKYVPSGRELCSRLEAIIESYADVKKLARLIGYKEEK